MHKNNIINQGNLQIPPQIEEYFNEQEYDKRELATENQELRARISELEEQLETEQTRSTALHTRHQEYISWTKKLFANKTIPESSKLVLWQYYFLFSQMRDNPVEEEMRISVEDTASALGLSTSTIRKATDKAEMFDVLIRRYEPLKMENGEKRTLMFLSLNPVVSTPEDIQMEKHHGGPRTPSCPSCGSLDVDRYTVQYCRSCQTNAWYGQPGLRTDANLIHAQDAQQAQTGTTDKKQDAFEPSTPSVAIDEFYGEPQTEHIEDAIPGTTDKKQDAFEPIASSDRIENQLAAELRIRITAASCEEWKDPVCRFCGPIAEFVWSSSEQCRICPHCYSPRD